MFGMGCWGVAGGMGVGIGLNVGREWCWVLGGNGVGCWVGTEMGVGCWVVMGVRCYKMGTELCVDR